MKANATTSIHVKFVAILAVAAPLAALAANGLYH
jgi:hypothetical protein